MSDVINEALLEMHYHPAIRDCFEAVYGSKMLRLLKPSPQQEAWVGFDQAWVRTDYDTSEILSDLRLSLTGVALQQRFYLGFFLQFKFLQSMSRRSKHAPSTYTAPYYRSELSMEPNKHTNLSQHATLQRLATLANTSVHYACAMIDSADEIYNYPNLNKLICVDVASAPAVLDSSSRHFITVQSLGSQPHWCSEPVPGSSMLFQEWARAGMRRKRLSGPEAASLITQTIELMDIEVPSLRSDTRDPLVQRIPESLIILEFSGEDPAR